MTVREFKKLVNEIPEEHEESPINWNGQYNVKSLKIIKLLSLDEKTGETTNTKAIQICG